MRRLLLALLVSLALPASAPAAEGFSSGPLIAQNGSMRVRLAMWADGSDDPPLVLQRPAIITLRVGAQELDRLRRCLRVRLRPTTSGCPA